MAHAATAMRTGKGLCPSLTLRSFIVPFQRAKLPAAISRWDDFLVWQERGRAIHGLDPAAEIAIPSGYQASMRRSPRTPGPIHVAVIVLLVYVVIGALNTLAMAALARRAELAILRLVGATGDQVLRMARIEQAMLLGLAPIAGGVHRRADNRSA